MPNHRLSAPPPSPTVTTVTAQPPLRTWATAVVLALVVCTAFFSPVLWTSKIFPSDGQYGAYAQHWALWASEWAAGWPLLADTPSMASYPLKIVLSRLGAPFDAFVLCAYIVTFVGTYVYATALRLRRLAALTSAISFTFSGWMLSHLGHTSMIHAAAWLPWMLFAIERWITEPFRGRYLALLAFSSLLSILAGHLQITVYALILTGGYVIFRAMHTARWMRNTSLLFGALLCGIAASSIALLPTLELAPLTMRDALTPETLFQFSLNPRQALDLAVPFLHGIAEGSFVGLPFFGAWSASEVTGYAAHVTWALAAIAVASILTRTRDRALCAFWFIVALAAYGLALGDSFTPGAWLTWWTPVLDKFRAQGRHLYEFSFAISMLGGLGMQAISESAQSRRRLATAAPVLLFASAVVATVLMYPSLLVEADASGVRLPSVTHHAAVAAAIVSMSLTLAALWIAKHSERAWTPIVVGLLVAQCVFYGYQLPWRAMAPEATYLAVPKWAGAYRDRIGSDYRILGMDGYEKDYFGPELARLYGVRTLGWYGPLILKHVSELSGVTNAGWTRRESLAANNFALDVLAVRYVAADRKDEPIFAAQPTRWRKVESVDDGMAVYENLRAMPRTWVVGSTVYLRPYPALVAIASGGPVGEGTFDPREIAVVHSAVDVTKATVKPDASTRIVSDGGRRLSIDVASTAPGWLIVADAWYPGWVATVNGHAAEIIRANYAMRAVRIPAGQSEVRMTYRPKSVVIGSVISLAALVAVFLLSVFVKPNAMRDGTV